MMTGSSFTILYFLYYKLIGWVDKVVVGSFLLTLSLVGDPTALNVQDSLTLTANHLQ